MRRRRTVHESHHAICLALQYAAERLAVREFDDAGEMVRVESGIREFDVLAHAGVVAIEEVREVRADSLPFAANRVTLRTGELVAEKEPLSAQPVSAGNFVNHTISGHDRFAGGNGATRSAPV